MEKRRKKEEEDDEQAAEEIGQVIFDEECQLPFIILKFLSLIKSSDQPFQKVMSLYHEMYLYENIFDKVSKN